MARPKKRHFYSSDLLLKEKQVWAVLTDFISIIPFCSIFYLLAIFLELSSYGPIPSVSNAAVDHEIKKFYVVVVQWRERNAPNSVMRV